MTNKIKEEPLLAAYVPQIFQEEDLKIIINALQDYRRKLHPENPKAVKASNLINYLKEFLPEENK